MVNRSARFRGNQRERDRKEQQNILSFTSAIEENKKVWTGGIYSCKFFGFALMQYVLCYTKYQGLTRHALNFSMLSLS